MNKIRVIDLLNKIANDKEVPKKIKYHGVYRCSLIYDKEQQDYSVGGKYYMFQDLFSYQKPIEFLNDEVEIIEEDKKIEQLKWNEKSSYNQEGDTKKVQKILLSRSEQLKSSINEIIDYLEEKE